MEKKLTDVIEEAFENSMFLEELLSDADKALAGKTWELSSDERKKLDDFLNNDQVGDPATILRAFNSCRAQGRPWDPPPWNPVIPPYEEST